MISSNTLESAFDTQPRLNIHLHPEECPACGQEIPPERLEEIRGKIAVREREQTLAITSQLEEQFSIQKAEADANAKAALQLERQNSAAREARVKEEVRRAADEEIAEAEKDRQIQVSGLQQRIAEVQLAQQSAEQMKEKLEAEINQIQAANATAIDAAKAEATRIAEATAAERIAGIEAAQKESENGLKAQIEEAKANETAAEQKRAALTLQIDELQISKASEIAKIKEDGALEADRIREAAAKAVEARFQEKLTAQDKAVADANAKAHEAEAKATRLEEQHTSAMDAQRGILEKDKEAAVNAERSKAFEENQKLSSKVNDLQRELENKRADELGEGAEVDIYEALKAEFPDDKITRIAKGAPGADIRQIVILRGKACGTILYDSKNHKQFRNEHVTKLKTDQLAEKAEHAILSTHKFPQGTRQIHIQDGVLLANPARVLAISTILRQHLLQVSTLRLSGIERENKTAALYEFINSEHCTLLLGRIDERANDLLDQQEKEIRWHQNSWNKRGETIRSIQKAKVDLENKIGSIIGTSGIESAMSEAS